MTLFKGVMAVVLAVDAVEVIEEHVAREADGVDAGGGAGGGSGGGCGACARARCSLSQGEGGKRTLKRREGGRKGFLCLKWGVIT